MKQSSVFIRFFPQILSEKVKVKPKTISKTFLVLTLSLLPLLVAPRVQAQTVEDAQLIALTLDEALQIALVQNLALKNVKLELDNSSALVKEGWAELFPQVDVNSSFTRNVRSANPFSGSQAGSLFETLGFLDWLAFNEQARTDGSGNTSPVSVDDFFTRRAAGIQNAGVNLGTGDNPFSVPNVSFSGISISQKLFDGRIIYGAVGASKWLEPFGESGVSREEQVLMEQVKTTWYGAILSEEQERVASESVMRAKRTLGEVARQVSLGTAPKFQRLSAEVEVSNLETALVQAGVRSAESRDAVKILLNVPAQHTIELRGDLESELDPSFVGVSTQEAALLALQKRPDLEQARIGVELEKIQLRVAKADYLPNLDAFANFNWIGSIPDNRQNVTSVPGDPFTFTTSDNGYFDSSYWDRSVNIGLSMTWTIFNGLASHRRIQQRKIAVQRAENDQAFLNQSIQIEVQRALRNVRAANTRLLNQRRNVDRAELNFEFAEARLKEGMATPLEVREASDQLDQTRLNYLQAVHDVLVAQTAYETSVGHEVNL